MGWTNGVSKNSRLVVIKAGFEIADTHWAFATALDNILITGRQRKSVVLFPRASTDKFKAASVVPSNWLAVKTIMQEMFGEFYLSQIHADDV